MERRQKKYNQKLIVMVCPVDYEMEVQKILINLRDPRSFSRVLLPQLRKTCQEGGLSLADIGTSEKELKKLEINSLMVRTGLHLQYFRESKTIRESLLQLRLLKEVCQERGMTLADIGISKEEEDKLNRQKPPTK